MGHAARSFAALRMTAVLLLAGTSAAADARVLGSISFQPCEIGGASGTRLVKAECARYDVPENHQEPAGRKITLQLALVPARSREPEPDLVVLLAGGPGQSALEAYPEIARAFDAVRRHRHVLLVDQRGTGKSNPLKCPLPDWKDPAAATPAAVRHQAVDCLAQLSPASDPRFYTTTDAIRDLEAVRQALGGPAYNLVGGSYGTRVALEYLRRHPAAVRTVVIDSVVPPELALLQDHAANLDEAVSRVFAACRADAACAKRFGDPQLTLARLREQLRAGPVRAAIHDPLTHVPREEALNEDLLAGVIRLYAYQTEAAALLPLLIDEAVQGRPQALIAQGELIFQRMNDQLAHGMELSVICAEDAPLLKAREEDKSTLMGPLLKELAQQQCAVWPRGDMPADFKSPVTSDKPVLLLSGELDPVTPPRYAAHVAKTLSNSRHLVLKGQGHSVMSRGCAPRLLSQFVEAADPEAVEPACLDALGAMPAFTSYQGPEP
jgi:pimeloyl-ACP methyl ester carboxylesterase